MRGIQLSFAFEVPAAPSDSSVGRSVSLLALARRRLISLGLERLEKEVRIVWNSRMRSTAGRALWPEGLIELNPALKEIGVEEVERTLLHELAHLVAFERAGRRRIAPHGGEWKQACAELGIPGETASHRLELPTRQLRRQWAYRCPHCLVEVERVRRMGRNMACWPCCRQFSGGEYDARFKFVERRLDA